MMLFIRRFVGRFIFRYIVALPLTCSMFILVGQLAVPAFAHALPTGNKMIVKGKLLERRLSADSQQQYYLYIPSRLAPRAPIFVTVHGISRNAFEHATWYAPFAERYGVVLVAPHFPVKEFAGYQRLKERGMRASDIALDRIIREVGTSTGADTSKLYLFGYSGGGQFVHRYAMAHPQNVARVSIGAAGWYTFPSADVKYPRGTLVNKKYKGLSFDPAQFLKVPTQVVVGARDRQRDEELNQSQKITLQQGPTRLKRGRAWIDSMHAAADSMGLQTEYAFEVMDKCNHSFRRCMQRGNMGELVFGFLFGPHAQLASGKAAQAPAHHPKPATTGCLAAQVCKP
jgi:pimeloyl-ACP methyl ester carboxylesterase